jgi:AcrR family transcriptional regulator
MRTRRKEVSDEAVIRGMFRLLQRIGPRFSLAEAGREVGLTAARLVQRFGGRSGLLRAVFESWGRTSLDAMEALLTIERPLAAYLDWVRAGLAGVSPVGIHQSLTWLQIAAEDPVLRRWYAEHIDRSLEALVKLLRRAIAVGELAPSDCRRLAERLAIIVSGAVVLSAGRGASGAELSAVAHRELAAALAPHRPRRSSRRKASIGSAQTRYV